MINKNERKMLDKAHFQLRCALQEKKLDDNTKRLINSTKDIIEKILNREE